MADFQNVRATLREPDSALRNAGGKGHIYLALIAFLGFLIGAAAVLFLPRAAPVKPAPDTVSQALPERGAEPAAELSQAPDTAAARDGAADPEALAATADSACLQQAQARHPGFWKTPRLTTKERADFVPARVEEFGALARCLLTQSPARYCSAPQRTMVTAELVTYFGGIDHLNKTPGVGGKPPAQTIRPDPRVIEAIEARLRDGLLTRSEFDQMKTALPARVRERLEAVPIGRSACPTGAWWTIWR